MNFFGKKSFIVLLFAIVSGVTSQETSHSLNDPPPATSSPMPTISFENTLKNTVFFKDTQPDLFESENGNGLNSTQTQQTLVALIFVAAVVVLCVVGCVAFLGGMYCWYKHTHITSSERRVLYRSSDSSVLIHNEYQPMGERHETGNPATNNIMSRLADKTDYPAYGVTGPNPLHNANKGPPIDMNLNRSAEVYHYQQQKQTLKTLNSSASSDGIAHSHPNTNDMQHQTMSPGGGSGNLHEDDEENSDGEYTVYGCAGLASTSDGPMEIHNPLFADPDSEFLSYPISPLESSMETSTCDYLTTKGGQE